MKIRLKHLTLIFSVFIFWNCSNTNTKLDTTAKHKIEVNSEMNESVTKEDIKEIMDDNIFPIQIEFGAIGIGSNLPPSRIRISKDSIKILEGEQLLYSFSNKESNLKEILDKYSSKDFEGEKQYSTGMRDGGYMEITNKHGKRKFSNCFGFKHDRTFLGRDTTNLSRYEEIYFESLKFLRR